MCSVHANLDLLHALFERNRMTQIHILDAIQTERIRNCRYIKTNFNPKFYDLFAEYDTINNISYLMAISHSDYAGGHITAGTDPFKIVAQCNCNIDPMIELFLLNHR
jgi:hypothetical protein